MPVLMRTQALRRRSIDPQRVRLAAERMLDALELLEAELSILLCSDEVIHELNRDYRGIDRPTDVLAFAMEEPVAELDATEAEAVGAAFQAFEAPGARILGDIVISLERGREQALRAGKTIAEEIVFLLAHGLLHLLGHDHRTKEEEREMNAMTTLLCAVANSTDSVENRVTATPIRLHAAPKEHRKQS